MELLLYTIKEVLVLLESEGFEKSPGFLIQLNFLVDRISRLTETMVHDYCNYDYCSQGYRNSNYCNSDYRNSSFSSILKSNLFENLISGARASPMRIPNPESTASVSPLRNRVLKKEKITVPESPNYNFIGRILGPRGISVRQLEAATGCGILIRGKGSVKVGLIIRSLIIWIP